MRLKKIILTGFKSFVDRTPVSFPTQMTCVVGPNGCGKSNTIDAVRWVLGESSAKNLRGDDMTDVIFNGSTHRKPVSLASVELVFENTEGKLQGSLANRTEVSLKREVTRDKKNTYYLNGEKCRRKDITELFLGTGLGARSYAIIEQGMISRLIESKPQELRVFLEEAAGISKYKERRKDTESRIKSTRANLERLDDVRHEIGRSIEKLKRQSTAALRYKELKTRERELKSELAQIRFNIQTDKAEQIEKQLLNKTVDLERYRSETTNSDLLLTQLKVKRETALEEQEKNQKMFFTLSNELTKTEQQISNVKTLLNKLNQDILKANDTISRAKAHLESEEDEIRSLTDEIEDLTPQLESDQEQFDSIQEMLFEKQEQLDALQKVWQSQIEAKSSITNKLAHLNARLDTEKSVSTQTTNRIKELNEELRFTETELNDEATESLKSTLATLTELKSRVSLKLDEQTTAHTNLVASINTLKAEVSELRTSQQKRQSRLDSLYHLQNEADSSMSSLTTWLEQNSINGRTIFGEMEIADGWETAVENALGFFGNPIHIENLPDNLPDGHLSSISGFGANKEQKTLAEKITNNKFPDIFNKLSIYNPDIETDELTIDTEGTIRYKSWIHKGSSNAQNGYFARKKEIQQLEIEMADIAHSIANTSSSLAAEVSNANALSEIIDQVKHELSTNNSDIVAVSTELRVKTAQQESSLSKLNRLKQQILDAELRIEQSSELQFTLESNIDDLTEQLSTQSDLEPETETNKSRLAHDVQNLRLSSDRVNGSLHEVKMKHHGATTKLEAIRKSLAKTSTMLEYNKEELTLLNEEIIETRMPLEDLIESQQHKLADLSEAEDYVNLSKAKVENLNSQIYDTEHGQSSIKQKENQIQEQINDLALKVERHRLQAMSQLEILKEMGIDLQATHAQVIEGADEAMWEKNLNETMQSIVHLGAVNLAAIEEFDRESERKRYLDQQNDDLVSALEILEQAIAKIDKETRTKFKETFDQVNEGLQTLFPKVFGGGAAYLDLTDQNLLEAGVTIMARPPGKKNSTIHLLSGGEKALTALSLVFSIFKLNPAPFCMLDEVDAPLDDVNVGRFCKLVQEMSDTVQFIYISHNKVAMEMAHQLAGVTMHEAGVSRLVSVDIEQAAKWLNN